MPSRPCRRRRRTTRALSPSPSRRPRQRTTSWSSGVEIGMTGATAAWSLSRSPDRDSVRAGVAGRALPRRRRGGGGGGGGGGGPRAGRGGGGGEPADRAPALRRARDGDERGFRELWAALQP